VDCPVLPGLKTEEKHESNLGEKAIRTSLEMLAHKVQTQAEVRPTGIGRTLCSFDAYGFSHLTAEMRCAGSNFLAGRNATGLPGQLGEA